MFYHFDENKCSCVGKNGQSKNLYFSLAEALDMANYRRSCDNRVELEVYKCPKDLGWHLRKKRRSVYG
jgi:hypothetical protein